MNFFGVGGAELLAIFIIMLVFAGPKRMIHWSYLMGKQVAKFRKIWSQTVDLVQKEFDDAGVGIQLPKEPPTRQNLNKAIGSAMQPVTKPLEDSISEVKKDVDVFKDVSDSLNDKKPASSAAKTSDTVAKAREAVKPKTIAKAAKTQAESTASLGSWSGEPAAASAEASSNGSGDLGVWSSGGQG